MNAETEILTEESLEKVTEPKPVAVYSVNFAEAIGNFTEKRLVRRRKWAVGKKAAIEKPAVERSLSKKIFNWRTAVPVGAILVIGVLHFAFQISVIRPEMSENRAILEVPPVKVEPARAAAPVEPAAIAPVLNESKESEQSAPQKNVLRVKSRQTEARQFEAAPPQQIAPAKPVVRKKDAVESRAERLRRAEKLLTGI